MPAFDLIDSFCHMILKICCRVHDQLPLYDILNQFQKGHSYMAVVVKRKKDAKEIAEMAKSKATVSETNMSSNLKQRQAELKGKVSRNRTMSFVSAVSNSCYRVQVCMMHYNFQEKFRMSS